MQSSNPMAAASAHSEDGGRRAAEGVHAWLSQERSPLFALMHTRSLGRLSYEGACAE